MSKFDCLLHRVLPATAESIGHLTALKGTPLAYLLTPRLPAEHTAVGPVQAGSPLPYHVCMTLTDLASTAVQTVQNVVLKICQQTTYKPNFINDWK